MKVILTSVTLVCSLNIFAASLTSAYDRYKAAVIQSAEDDFSFENFRKNQSVMEVYEHVTPALGSMFFANIVKYHPNLLDYLPEFRKNDLIGDPLKCEFYPYGQFSPVTLRYVHFLGELDKMFDLTDGYKIVEVGVGYGGQCAIVSKFLNFSSYELIDLDYVLPLVNRYLNALDVKNFITKSPEEYGNITDYDLFISNYGISECDKKTQDEYLEKVICFCKRGYILYNSIYEKAYNVSDWCDRLRMYGIDPKVRAETVSTDMNANKNVVIYWGAK
jgi:hypothetical protein